jgi:hypothetical protein
MTSVERFTVQYGIVIYGQLKHDDYACCRASGESCTSEFRLEHYDQSIIGWALTHAVIRARRWKVSTSRARLVGRLRVSEHLRIDNTHGESDDHTRTRIEATRCVQLLLAECTA